MGEGCERIPFTQAFLFGGQCGTQNKDKPKHDRGTAFRQDDALYPADNRHGTLAGALQRVGYDRRGQLFPQGRHLDGCCRIVRITH